MSGESRGRLFHHAHAAFDGVVRDADWKCATGAYKPPGFWFDVGGDWIRWCEGESWGTGWTHHYEVFLAPDANVKWIDNVAELRAFTGEFGTTPEYVRKYRGDVRQIDWPRVAKLYDGLVIAPYLWDARFDPHWYYGWDCASGVVWKGCAIARVEAIARADVPVCVDAE